MDLELRRNLVRKFHDLTMIGHSGQYKTIKVIQKYYWWPEIYTFVKNYIAGYVICQQNKMNTHLTMLLLTPIKSNGERPFLIIMMDFITNLPKSHDYNSILVIIDYGLTKRVVLIPCTKTFGTLETVNALLKNVY
jgi:hypothetical protein